MAWWSASSAVVRSGGPTWGGARAGRGRPRRGASLGVSPQPVELQDSLKARLALEQSTGLMLFGLEPGAPADRDGLLLGDIVLVIGGRAIEDAEDLQLALGPDVI